MSLSTPNHEELASMTDRPPPPPFNRQTGQQKVQATEDAWNTRDPERVALAVNGRPRSCGWRGAAATIPVCGRTYGHALQFRQSENCVSPNGPYGPVLLDGPSLNVRSPCRETGSRRGCRAHCGVRMWNCAPPAGEVGQWAAQATVGRRSVDEGAGGVARAGLSRKREGPGRDGRRVEDWREGPLRGEL